GGGGGGGGVGGGGGGGPSVRAGAVALALVVAGAVLSRAAGDATAGTVLGYAALPFGFLSGLVASGADRTLGQFGAAHLLIGSAAGMLLAVLAAGARGGSAPGLIRAPLAALGR